MSRWVQHHHRNTVRNTSNLLLGSHYRQPPKKTAGKKAAKAKAPTVIDGLAAEEMSKEQVRANPNLF